MPEAEGIDVRKVVGIGTHGREKATRSQHSCHRPHNPPRSWSVQPEPFYQVRQSSQHEYQQNQRNAEMTDTDVEAAQQTKTGKNDQRHPQDAPMNRKLGGDGWTVPLIAPLLT